MQSKAAAAQPLPSQNAAGGELPQKLVKIKRKIICAIASEDKNENIDLWLTMGDKRVCKVLSHGQTLVAIFSKQMKKGKRQGQGDKEAPDDADAAQH